MRRRADAARVVIANHALVFADVIVRQSSQDQGVVLPAYEAIVFDEAHQIEDIASEFFGVRVSTSQLDAFARAADQAFRAAGMVGERLGVVAAATGGAAKGKSRRRKRAAAGVGLLDAADSGSTGEAGASITAPVVATGRSLFESLAQQHTSGALNAKQVMDRSIWFGDLRDRYHRLDAAVEAVEAFAARGSDDDVKAIGVRASEIRKSLARIVDGEPGLVSWLEKRLRSAAVGATPIEVGHLLRQFVFERVGASILTSATLTTSSGFRFFRSRVGVDSDTLDTRELEVPSPFDFSENALLYTPLDLPEPSNHEFAQKAAERTAELIDITGGGALILCTSNRSMMSLYDSLSQRRGYQVWMQGEAPKSTLLDRFRQSGNAVLVATMSFWEGVDIAGRALRLVVIDKIPFAVPDDPVVMARCAAIEGAGGKPFFDFQVPSAAITLKQGFGRLIRSRRDQGIVAVLDGRIVRKGYGKAMIRSLPPARRVETLEEVRVFWSHSQVGMDR